MNESSATRYLMSKGWKIIEEGWFALKGMYEEPVCIDTAYVLQQMLDDSRQAA